MNEGDQGNEKYHRDNDGDAVVIPDILQLLSGAHVFKFGCLLFYLFVYHNQKYL